MFFSVHQAAEALGVHANTVYNLIKRGRVVAFKGPYGWEVLRSSVELLANDQYRYTSQVEQAVQVIQASKHLLNQFREPMSMSLCDEDPNTLKPLMRNEAYKELLGWPEHILSQMRCSEILHPDDWEMAMQTISLLPPLEKSSAELRLRRSDLRYIWVRASGLVVPVDGGVKIVISKIKKL